MDKMLQMKILQIDTRLLYVPVAIERLSIDSIKHVTMLQNMEKEEEETRKSEGSDERFTKTEKVDKAIDKVFPVYVHKETNVVRYK